MEHKSIILECGIQGNRRVEPVSHSYPNGMITDGRQNPKTSLVEAGNCICYDAFKKEKAMSLLISLKKRNYILMASDSLNLYPGERDNNHYRKILSFEKMLVGITGRTTFEGRELEEHIRNWLLSNEEAGIRAIEEHLEIVQRQLKHPEVVNLHIAYAEDHMLKFCLFDIWQDQIQKTYSYQSNHIAISGVCAKDVNINIDEMLTEKEDYEMVKNLIHYTSLQQKMRGERQTVGGLVQCMALYQDGTISALT